MAFDRSFTLLLKIHLQLIQYFFFFYFVQMREKWSLQTLNFRYSQAFPFGFDRSHNFISIVIKMCIKSFAIKVCGNG